MSEILTGLGGRQYTITNHIKSGGEGGVYDTNASGLVAKIYDTSKINIDARMAELENKIKYMVNHRIPTKLPDGTVIVTWPQDVLYKNGKFVGYIMPKVSGAKPIYMLNRGGKQANEVIPDYNWKKAAIVASNLAFVVDFLHSKNVVIGDMNSDNLLVYPNGFIVIIDTDSFDIVDNSLDIHYKCSVGTEEFLPPELQGCNLERKNARFTKHTDEFALAVHIFQLLMNNMHPFNARVIKDYKQSLPENSQNYNIVVGNCPFVRTIDGCATPLGAPDMNRLLPDYLVEDFKATFDYQLNQSDPLYMDKLRELEQRRTSASVWHMHLKQLINDPNLIPCSVKQEHFYLSYKGGCAMCEAERGWRKTTNQYTDSKVSANSDERDLSSDSVGITRKNLKILKALLMIPGLILLFVGGVVYVPEGIFDSSITEFAFGFVILASGIVYLIRLIRSQPESNETESTGKLILSVVLIITGVLIFLSSVDYMDSFFDSVAISLCLIGICLFPFAKILKIAKNK